jgi:hypothetical protein
MKPIRANSEQTSCAVLAYARPRELDPSSIRSNTSCHGIASSSAGEPEIRDRTSHRSAATIQAIPPRKPDLRVSRTIHENPTCGPTYAALARTARCVRLCSRLLPAIHRGTLANQTSPWQLAFASYTGALGTSGRSSCSRIPAIQGPRDHILRVLREERPRSAIPEVLSVVGSLLDDPGLRPDRRVGRLGPLHSFSPACGKNAVPFSTFVWYGSLDGLPAAKARPPLRPG